MNRLTENYNFTRAPSQRKTVEMAVPLKQIELWLFRFRVACRSSLARFRRLRQGAIGRLKV